MNTTPDAAAAATALRIYPQYGGKDTPPWEGGYNLLFIHNAVGFDATKWTLTNALFSDARQLPNGVHVNLYPRSYGPVRIYQLGDDGDPLTPPLILFADPPRPQR